MHPLVCLATCPDGAVADRIARALVEEGLAACVNAVPGVRSTYRWEGRVVSDDEVLLTIKTTADRMDALGARLQSLHPYAVPALVALRIEGGLTPYLRWIEASVDLEDGAPAPD